MNPSSPSSPWSAEIAALLEQRGETNLSEAALSEFEDWIANVSAPDYLAPPSRAWLPDSVPEGVAPVLGVWFSNTGRTSPQRSARSPAATPVRTSLQPSVLSSKNDSRYITPQAGAWSTDAAPGCIPLQPSAWYPEDVPECTSRQTGAWSPEPTSSHSLTSPSPAQHLQATRHTVAPCELEIAGTPALAMTPPRTPLHENESRLANVPGSKVHTFDSGIRSPSRAANGMVEIRLKGLVTYTGHDGICVDTGVLTPLKGTRRKKRTEPNQHNRSRYHTPKMNAIEKEMLESNQLVQRLHLAALYPIDPRLTS